MNVLSIGGSRNIGYFSAIRLLDAGCTVTFLLRNTSVFDQDQTISKYVASGKAHLIKGDALVQSDVNRGWQNAAKHGSVDLLLFTVGGTPKCTISKGFVITPHNLVTQSLLNTFTTMPSSPRLKVIVISSTGLTRTSHASLPLLLKPFYAHFLAMPHKDKVGVERIVHRCTGWPWNAEDGEPDEDILGPSWTEIPGLPQPGSLKNVLVIRPAFLTDGECKAEMEGKDGYRVSEGEIGAWTVSRKDVAHFVANAALHKWDQYANKCISIAY
ncbi:hypothetical protein Moror_6795 [Moniliophthora roreri MCA 2997]|uniref:NAD(P)-binding domain-containing protein n=2 Tax=Moniliophthora roreri TaxID=221103 RepID=V2XVI6_MONRO|nr:hypothetical protein Moror_6795 [Moniliophthora roreri MCA 2997]KAI3618580.1 hypothetical protein WG66_016548 [Moniliophthora roreri]